MEPRFLSLDELLVIHRDQIERYGGSPLVRDLGLLQAAAATPAAGVTGKYLHAGLPEMAAAYLFHIVKNHPFVDGNKRVGAVAADVFLALNGLQLAVDPDEYADLVIAVASSKIGKSPVADFIRSHVERF